MKAVCVLVCLALARHCAGSIFHRRAPAPLDKRFDEAPEYIDPYLQEQYQRYLAQYPYAQQVHRQDEQQYPYAQVYRQDEKYQAPYPGQAIYEKERKHDSDHKERRPKYKQDMEHELRQEQPERKMITRYAESSSVENNSKEAFKVQKSLAGFDERFNAPMFADMGVVGINAMVLNEKPALSGDATVWRSLKMATSPEKPVEKKDIEKIYSEAMKAMKHIHSEEKTELHKAVEVAAEKDSEDAYLNATELLKKYQYPVEEHTIKTDDGYYLTLFHVSDKQFNEEKPRPVVFLMHGLLGSADDWLLMGPGKSLAYLLADAGYDVWLGNARGNKYTRHASKSRAQPDFWQYSNDEIALHDLPAMIDYVLESSKVKKIFYVGHSLGTTAFFALASARPEYNDKIVKMYALAPMAYMTHVRSPLMRMIAPSNKFYKHLQEHLGQGEFKPKEEVVRTIGGAMCENEIGCKKVCANVYYVTSGVNVHNLEVSQIPSIMKHLPAGGSTKQMKQYGQSVAAQEFQMYDYGSEMNEKVYGKPEPPKYKMENVRSPVVLYYSEHDWLAHPKDVERLQKELPKAEAKKIPEEYFTHHDFIDSKKATEQVYKNLIESIQKEEYKTEQEKQASY